MQVPAEPQLFLLDKLFAHSGWDSSHLTLVIKSNCSATHGFSVMHVLKGNVHQKRARVARRKLFCLAALLEIEAIAELKISGTSRGAFCLFHIFAGPRLKVVSPGHFPVLGKWIFIYGANMSWQLFLLVN